ncbi:transposase family protein [Actinomadura madurae]
MPLADRVLLIAVYYRTNLTLRQVALLLGVSKSAAHRVVDHLAPAGTGTGRPAANVGVLHASGGLCRWRLIYSLPGNLAH